MTAEGTPSGKWLRFKRALQAGYRRFRQLYMVADPRTLGLYRIVIGLLLVLNGINHWREATIYYSNEGVLTNDWHLFRPASTYHFSIFHAFSTPEEVHVAFALSLLCYLMFMVGWRSRLFAILSCFWVTSMDNRLVLVENGGYIVVNLSIFWACFLPVGQRFSVDSLLRSFRERREGTIAELSQRFRPSWLTKPRMSFAAFVLVVNFGFIYFFNVINKYGGIWRSGKTVHHVLHLDRMVTALGPPMREVLPLWAMALCGWGVLMVEAWIVMLIFWPRARRQTRPLAMVLICLLHVAFGTLMLLGPFSWFMIGWSTALLCPVHWEALKRFHGRRVAPVTVALAADCALALQVGRLLSRLDLNDSLRFESDDSCRLLRARRGQTSLEGAAAIWAIAGALPGGRLVALPLRIMSLGLAGPLLRWCEKHRDGIVAFFRLDQNEPEQPEATQRSWVGRKLDRSRIVLREFALLYLMGLAVSQMVNENKSIPKLFKHEQPWFVRATAQYPRIFQGWGMFSPNPIQTDGIVAVDAITIDGRHIDPFTGGAPDLNLSDARSMRMNQIHQDYFNRIRTDRNRAYHKPLREFLQRYHERTGRPEDELVAFDVYWLEDHNPAPGAETPYEHDKIAFISWRKPRYRPAPGLPKLPPKPKVRSAGK